MNSILAKLSPWVERPESNHPVRELGISMYEVIAPAIALWFIAVIVLAIVACLFPDTPWQAIEGVLSWLLGMACLLAIARGIYRMFHWEPHDVEDWN